MRMDNQRQSDNFEDRGRGGGGAVGGGLAAGALFAILRRIGFRGILIVGLLLAGIWFFAPQNIKQLVFGALLGGVPGQSQAQGEGNVCDTEAAACTFSRQVLASTEDVWSAQFSQGRLPNYGGSPGAYQAPTLVVFSGGVATEGCGSASSDVGPFYCPGDRKLYIDPGFYQVMQSRLNAPCDFAQAYVIAHEVGHHVQNLSGLLGRGEVHQIETELQADCLAGAWARGAEARGLVEVGDVDEALNAAAQIGDDTIQKRTRGRVQPETWTHGSAAQRKAAFEKGHRGGVDACGLR